MILYRTTDGTLLTRKPDEQYYTEPFAGKALYVSDDGRPVGDDGQPIPGEVVTKFVYTVEEYLAAFPKAEKNRAWLTRDRNGGELILVQTLPNWGCMVGNCYIVTYRPRFDHPKNPKYSMRPTVLVNDGDDAYTRKTFDTEEEARQAFEELKALAPFVMSELDGFGFVRE